MVSYNLEKQRAYVRSNCLAVFQRRSVCMHMLLGIELVKRVAIGSILQPLVHGLQVKTDIIACGFQSCKVAGHNIDFEGST